MNTEEVVAMIDAITEGKNYNLDLKVTEQSVDDGHFQFAASSFAITLGGGAAVAEIDDPRVAREIAGALVAWANKQDGNKQDAETMAAAVWGSPARVASKVTAPSIQDWSDIKSGRSSREEWYRRNVGNMSQETKDRNLRDLKGMLDLGDESPEQRDIDAAIQILLDNGAR